MYIFYILLVVCIYASESFKSEGGTNTADDDMRTTIEIIKNTRNIMSKRLKRGVVGNDVLAGLRALKNLLRKAQPYSREQGVKYFLKTGDFTTAMKDFNSLKPKDIKKFSTNVKVGTIGDRKVYIRKDESHPAVSISKRNENAVEISVVYNKKL